jgi:hypothetical protein
MPARDTRFPTHRERSALYLLLKKGGLPAAQLSPASASTISSMLGKGWLQRSEDPTFGPIYFITPAGEAALKAVIPSQPDRRRCSGA